MKHTVGVRGSERRYSSSSQLAPPVASASSFGFFFSLSRDESLVATVVGYGSNDELSSVCLTRPHTHVLRAFKKRFF